MGGRGRKSGAGTRQFSIKDEIERRQISNIFQENEIKRKALLGKGGGGGSGSSPQLYKKCKCCGEYSIPVNTEYETCPKCGWIDDPFQNRNPNSLAGKNEISLIHLEKNVYL